MMTHTTIWDLQENPTINFVGLLLGPRGNYLEKLKEETKCNIVIRGKGSLRSGMTGIKRDGSVVDGLEEPLHALITVSFHIIQKIFLQIQCLNIVNPVFYKCRAPLQKMSHEE